MITVKNKNNPHKKKLKPVQGWREESPQRTWVVGCQAQTQLLQSQLPDDNRFKMHVHYDYGMIYISRKNIYNPDDVSENDVNLVRQL